MARSMESYMKRLLVGWADGKINGWLVEMIIPCLNEWLVGWIQVKSERG